MQVKREEQKKGSVYMNKDRKNLKCRLPKKEDEAFSWHAQFTDDKQN